MENLLTPFLIFINPKRYIPELNYRAFIPAGILISILSAVTGVHLNTYGILSEKDFSLRLLSYLVAGILSILINAMAAILVKGLLSELIKVHIPFVGLLNLLLYAQFPLLLKNTVTLITCRTNSYFCYSAGYIYIGIGAFSFSIVLIIYGIITLSKRFNLLKQQGG